MSSNDLEKIKQSMKIFQSKLDAVCSQVDKVQKRTKSNARSIESERRKDAKLILLLRGENLMCEHPAEDLFHLAYYWIYILCGWKLKRRDCADVFRFGKERNMIGIQFTSTTTNSAKDRIMAMFNKNQSQLSKVSISQYQSKNDAHLFNLAEKKYREGLCKSVSIWKYIVLSYLILKSYMMCVCVTVHI